MLSSKIPATCSRCCCCCSDFECLVWTASCSGGCHLTVTQGQGCRVQAISMALASVRLMLCGCPETCACLWPAGNVWLSYVAPNDNHLTVPSFDDCFCVSSVNFSHSACSLSGCPRAKRSGIKITHSKEDKEDQEPIRWVICMLPPAVHSGKATFSFTESRMLFCCGLYMQHLHRRKTRAFFVIKYS